MQHFNGLEPEVAELLAVLAEECGEVVQQVGKILRHGLRVDPYGGIANAVKLENELTDVLTLAKLLAKLGVIDWDRVVGSIDAKLERLARPGMLHHSKVLSPRQCVRCGSTTELQHGPTHAPHCFNERACSRRMVDDV